MTPSKIYLGAGADRREGFYHVDVVSQPGIDLVWNVMNFPWPFEDSSAESILAIDLIEHLPTHLTTYESTYVKFFEECYRVLKLNGELFIQTPSYRAEFMWDDFTHVKPFSVRSFDFLDTTKPYGQTTGFYSKAKFSVKAEELENHNLRFWLTKR